MDQATLHLRLAIIMIFIVLAMLILALTGVLWQQSSSQTSNGRTMTLTAEQAAAKTRAISEISSARIMLTPEESMAKVRLLAEQQR